MMEQSTFNSQIDFGNEMLTNTSKLRKLYQRFVVSHPTTRVSPESFGDEGERILREIAEQVAGVLQKYPDDIERIYECLMVQFGDPLESLTGNLTQYIFAALIHRRTEAEDDLMISKREDFGTQVRAVAGIGL